MQADVEINKKKEEVKSQLGKELTQTSSEQKLLRNVMANNVAAQKDKAANILAGVKKDLEANSKE